MKAPIYTEKAKCQDCYKCLRQCPVKAIRVNNGSAEVIHELCIFCGKCIEVCPSHAKKLRSDTARARQMISLNRNVIASLAPSFPAEFDIPVKDLIGSILQLGFYGVSETSIGADIVSRKTAEELETGTRGIISSACPTVREYIFKYKPQLKPYLSDMVSPLHAHADLLKRIYGSDTRVVFIGPCISKKLEADDETIPVDLALTFRELREWFEEEGIDPGSTLPGENDDIGFIPEDYINASEFAIEGGMLNTVRKNVSTVDSSFFSFSGTANICTAFDDISRAAEKGVFLEYLACEGGCVSGRGMTAECSYIMKRMKVLEYYRNCSSTNTSDGSRNSEAVSAPGLHSTSENVPAAVRTETHTEEEIRRVLQSLDKYDEDDEINCSGCGYNSCRDFAAALIEGKAETPMCVTHMRKIAEKKSNALMKALPLSVVITDRKLHILECNEKFLHTFSEVDLGISEKIRSRIEGMPLDRFIPENNLFADVINSDNNMMEGRLRVDGRVFRTFVFRIGQEQMIGAIFQDITSPAVKREMLIKKTEEVIEKSLSSVQQIASLLGENAAETQLILNSLIETYSIQGDEEER